jgi:hypothetical protein
MIEAKTLEARRNFAIATLAIFKPYDALQSALEFILRRLCNFPVCLNKNSLKQRLRLSAAEMGLDNFTRKFCLQTSKSLW